MASKPRTVEEIFKDYRARRIAIIRALTRDIDELYGLCDPGKENLCLYGHPNEAWEVTLPSEEVPPELPEPALGINFARDDVSRKDWLSLVAVHSDSWLLSVAFYLGTRLSHNERKRLFGLINALPTIFQVVTSNKKIKDKFTMNSGNKSWGSTEAVSRKLRMVKSPVFPISHQGILLEKPTTNIHTRGNENVDIICGSCSEKYNKNEFWIGCDICEWWYHGKCVMMTPIKAETLKHYKCPSCCLRRGRP